MAAATAIIAGVAAAVSIGKSIHDVNKGNKIRRKAEDRIENYGRQSLRNVYAGTSVPTMAATLATEEAARTQAEASYLASQGGAQGAIGGAAGIADQTRETVSRIGASLTEAEFRLKSMIAEDTASIRGMQERREESDLAGLGAEVAYGRSLRDAGFNQAIYSASSLAELSMDTQWGDTKIFGGSKPSTKLTENQTQLVDPIKNTYSTGNPNKGR